jgi:hypothetical protein
MYKVERPLFIFFSFNFIYNCYIQWPSHTDEYGKRMKVHSYDVIGILCVSRADYKASPANTVRPSSVSSGVQYPTKKSEQQFFCFKPPIHISGNCVWLFYIN